MIDLKVTGLREEIDRLKKAQSDLARGEVFAEAWQTHVTRLVPLARAEAPAVTGELRASIRSRREGSTGILEATAPHAGYVHNGTDTQAANPYLDRSAAMLAPDLEKRIQTALEKRLK